jgi:hypothetical protein
MAGRNSGRDPYVIVVGVPDQEYVREMVRVVRAGGVEPALCDDVYAAVAALAGAGDRRTLVLGRLQELAREKGRFFSLAAANAARCCCLLEAGPAVRQSAVCAALRAGAYVVGATGEVRAVVQDWLADGQRPPRHRNLQGVQEDDFHATEAELSALLGQANA